MSDQKLLSMEEVRARVPVTRAALYAFINRGEFPKPLHVGRRIFWDARDIDAYVDGLRDKRDKAA